jgi:hypothetical protein
MVVYGRLHIVCRRALLLASRPTIVQMADFRRRVKLVPIVSLVSVDVSIP